MKIFRRTYGPVQDKRSWLPRWNGEIYHLYGDINIVEVIEIRRLGWACHIIRMEDERISKNSEWEISLYKSSRKSTNQMEGIRPEGNVKDHGNTRREKMSWRQEEMRRLLRGPGPRRGSSAIDGKEYRSM